MREIKFRGRALSNDKHAGIKKGDFVFGSFIKTNIDAPAIVWGDGEQMEVDFETVGQLTGFTDKNGIDIYEGDILNICFTSDSGEHIHDGVYSASSGALGGIQFDFIRLLWISFGYNQYCISSILCERYGKLSTVYANEKENLIVPDKYKMKVDNKRDFPFNNHKELSFSSRYFEVIGNIYENPELLEDL